MNYGRDYGNRNFLERAAHTVRLYAAFCEAAGVDDVAAVATSAVRDAANADVVLEALSADGALAVRTLSAEEEAWYGYLGVVNSTTLGDGHVLDLQFPRRGSGNFRGHRSLRPRLCFFYR